MRNWTIKEAINVINAGTDNEAIRELAKHFPEFFMAAVKGDIAALANAMPEKFTVRRLQFGATDAIGDTDTDANVETEDNDTAVAEPEDLTTLSTKQLMALCDKRGIKVPHYGKNKQFYLDALAGATDAADDGEADDNDTTATNPYDGKKAMELYKLCKERGLKVEPRQKAKVYIDALVAADNAATDTDGGDDGDWDDGEDEKPAAKPAKAAKAKPAKKEKAKPAPKAEPEDDDDSWDI